MPSSFHFTPVPTALCGVCRAQRPVAESPLVLIDAVTGDGITGHGIVFTCTAAALHPTAESIRNFEPLLKGESAAPSEIEHKLARRFRLPGTQGLVGMALAGIDMALWDALARSHNTSLVRLLGGDSPGWRSLRWRTAINVTRGLPAKSRWHPVRENWWGAGDIDHDRHILSGRGSHGAHDLDILLQIRTPDFRFDSF
jgi:hypothetical protein